MIQSFLLFVVAIVGLFLPVVAQHRADTRLKSEKACLAEWRAQGASHAKGKTQAAFVEQCRGGHTAVQTATSTAAPSTNGAASPLQKPSHPSAHLAQRRVAEPHSRHHARQRNEQHASRAARADSSGGF